MVHHAGTVPNEVGGHRNGNFHCTLFFTRYGWTGAGMIMISVPILTSRKVVGTGDSGIGERTEYYTIAKHLLMSAGDAMERLMTAYKV